MCIAAKKEIQASCVFYTMRKKGDRVTWSAVRRFIRLGNSITYTMYIPSVATANDWRTIDWNGLLEIKNKHKQNENKIFKYPSVRFFFNSLSRVHRTRWMMEGQTERKYIQKKGGPCLYCTFTQEWLGVHKRHRSDMPLSISLYIPDYYFFYVSLTASIPSQTLLTSRWCTRVHHRKKKREK